MMMCVRVQPINQEGETVVRKTHRGGGEELGGVPFPVGLRHDALLHHAPRDVRCLFCCCGCFVGGGNKEEDASDDGPTTTTTTTTTKQQQQQQQQPQPQPQSALPPSPRPDPNPHPPTHTHRIPWPSYRTHLEAHEAGHKAERLHPHAVLRPQPAPGAAPRAGRGGGRRRQGVEEATYNK